jgi:hypothetical protein
VVGFLKVKMKRLQMKKFKKVLILLIGVLVFATSCEKTDEGPVDDRDKFIGTWNGQSDGPGGHRNFTLVITAGNSSEDQIKMQGFDGGSGAVFATVSGNLFSIPSQLISGETIQGDGNFSSDELNFSFTIDDGQSVENRTGKATGKH